MTEPLTTTLGGRPARAAPRPGTIERIPKWLNLVPMVLQWCWLGLRHGSLTLPSAVNPQITAGGLVGDTKSEYFAGMGAHARSRVAPYVMLRVEGGDMLAAALSAMNEAGLAFPVVAKPDLGWCGFGVRRLDDAPELADYLRQYPAVESLMLQRYLDEPGYAGIFYVRHPDQPRGWLLGILLRHYPQVIGDGVCSVAQLIRADARLHRAIVNQAFAHRYFSGRGALGQTLSVPRLRTAPANLSDDSFEIVGVVKDTVNRIATRETIPEVYIPFTVAGMADRIYLASRTRPEALDRAAQTLESLE